MQAEFLSRSIQWKFDTGNGAFCEYDQLANLEIETAYSSKQSNVLLTVNKNTLSSQTNQVMIDFALMIEIDQRTSQRRKICRIDFNTRANTSMNKKKQNLMK